MEAGAGNCCLVQVTPASRDETTTPFAVPATSTAALLAADWNVSRRLTAFARSAITVWRSGACAQPAIARIAAKTLPIAGTQPVVSRRFMMFSSLRGLGRPAHVPVLRQLFTHVERHVLDHVLLAS